MDAAERHWRNRDLYLAYVNRIRRLDTKHASDTIIDRESLDLIMNDETTAHDRIVAERRLGLDEDQDGP